MCHALGSTPSTTKREKNVTVSVARWQCFGADVGRVPVGDCSLHKSADIPGYVHHPPHEELSTPTLHQHCCHLTEEHGSDGIKTRVLLESQSTGSLPIINNNVSAARHGLRELSALRCGPYLFTEVPRNWFTSGLEGKQSKTKSSWISCASSPRRPQHFHAPLKRHLPRSRWALLYRLCLYTRYKHFLNCLKILVIWKLWLA